MRMVPYHRGNEAMIIHGAPECVPGPIKQVGVLRSLLYAAKRSVVDQEKGRVHRQAAAGH
jgi:hypothetical protein